MSYKTDKLTLNKAVTDVVLNSMLQQDMRDYDNSHWVCQRKELPLCGCCKKKSWEQ